MKQLTRSGLASDVTFEILTAKLDTNRVNISSHLNQKPYDHEWKCIFVDILGYRAHADRRTCKSDPVQGIKKPSSD